MSHGHAVPEELREPAGALRRAIPEVYDGYRRMHAAVYAAGALDEKTKELIELAIAVSKECDGCIASHARGAVRTRATGPEVAEALSVAIAMNGGPGTVYGPRAFAAFREFAEEAGPQGDDPRSARQARNRVRKEHVAPRTLRSGSSPTFQAPQPGIPEQPRRTVPAGTDTACIPPVAPPSDDSDAAMLRELLAASAVSEPFSTSPPMPNAAPPLHWAARRRAADASSPSVHRSCKASILRPTRRPGGPRSRRGRLRGSRTR
jgi:AhpD family alkylhydroperoxidase